ncbi:hypothetical protein [Streptacidiphilus sp. ASG 303]|uniref:hypothetical protein n=1 Tax=Streptacidiphilus sp. ASG 303 TaxID=2896847 RepID=UPI0035B04234
MPFHPSGLGEDALRALCGSLQEGRPEPGDVGADVSALYGFHGHDPQGPDAAEQEAELVRAVEVTGPPRFSRPVPDGSLIQREEVAATRTDSGRAPVLSRSAVAEPLQGERVVREEGPRRSRRLSPASAPCSPSARCRASGPRPSMARDDNDTATASGVQRAVGGRPADERPGP